MTDNSTNHLRSFGRKQGRAPKGIRQNAMESLMPYYAINLDIEKIGDISELFDKSYNSYAVEIGFGAGEHLYHQAKLNPDCGFIGCEPFLNGIANLMTQLQEEPLDNLRIWQEDARLLLEKLPENSINKAFILFPDPWPKLRHHKRRLVKHDLLDQLSHIMPSGSLLRMATDHHGYASWMLAQILSHSKFEWSANSQKDWQQAPSDWISTRYQQKALASDITTYIDSVRV